MVSKILDFTGAFNANNGVKMDLSGWLNATVQVVTPSGTINVTGSNDAGAITGVTDGNALSSDNYTAIQLTNLATGAAVTTISANGLYKTTQFGMPCKFIQLAGTGVTVAKLLVFVNTIN
jgi:hypothetical protein